ncbi:MAG TPA: hypothetical protein VMV72_09310 [Verrucomicrobiae bacterium]|nr:hypothetical protein [Verrucomicrobiae bacterium]
MRTSSTRPRFSGTGITMTELAVLVAIGSLLSAVLLADLAQTQQTLLLQACAANLKQWGMAIELYSQDHNGSIFYTDGGLFWNTAISGNPYSKYLGVTSTTASYIRNLRVCPARAAALSPQLTSVYSYQMPVGMYRAYPNLNLYANCGSPGNPYYYNVDVPYLPNLKSCHNPSQFLLLTESRGNTMLCRDLLQYVLTPYDTSIPSQADPLAPIYRHNGLINCLFGDLHVEAVTTNTLATAAANCFTTNSWLHLD